MLKRFPVLARSPRRVLKVRNLLDRMSKYYTWRVRRPAGGPFHVMLQRREREIERRTQGFGRTIIFADRHSWGDEDIVSAQYRWKHTS